MRFQTAFLATTLLAAKVSAHSWVWCTDYQVADPSASPNGPDETDSARRNFDDNLCDGYSPNFPTFFDATNNANFGLDSGYENRPQFTSGDPNSQLCLSRPNTYTTAQPMAEYNAGETICLAYPAKNHVAALTTNQFIPDAGNAIYMAPFGSAVTDTNFPATSSFVPDGLLPNFNGLHTNGQIDYLGYQNCPDFDAGNDRALCTMCFDVPSDLQTGEYYFAWHWEFNVGEHYSTCWSAQVAGGAAVETTTEVTTTTEAETTTTEVQETIAGEECEIEALALCDRGLGRGTCAVTDADAQAADPTTGFVCDCEDGFTSAVSSMICTIEEDIQLRIVLDLLFEDIMDQDLLELTLQLAIGDALELDSDRLSFTFSANEDGNLVALLSISGQAASGDLTALSMASSLTSLADSDAIHDAGFMSNTLSVTCLNCDDDVTTEAAAGAAAALAPSMAVAVAAAIAALAL